MVTLAYVLYFFSLLLVIFFYNSVVDLSSFYYFCGIRDEVVGAHPLRTGEEESASRIINEKLIQA